MSVGVRRIAVLMLPAIWCTACAPRASAAPFYMGADISLETFMQEQNPTTLQPNARFFDDGVEAPMDTIMYKRGANLFRVRIFVNPATTYVANGPNPNYGAIQNLDAVINLAKQIQINCPHAQWMLDFHYSDTWADPGQQTLPAAWETPTQTLSQLQSTVETYTRDTLLSLKDAGVMPDIVQLGNETTAGMLWPTGRLNFNGTTAQKNASWAAYGGLLNAGIAGVRSVEEPGEHIPIALSIDRGDKDGQPQYHYGMLQRSTTVPVGGLTGGGVTDFDIQGVDFYPSSTNLISTMQSNLTTLANTNYNAFLADPTKPMKKIMVLETNYPWTNSSVGSSMWPKTPDGQKAELEAVRDLVLGLPHDAGLGVLYWYPEAVRIKDNGTGVYGVYNNGATALFDSNLANSSDNAHNALEALEAFEITLVPGDYDYDRVVDEQDLAVWSSLFGQSVRGWMQTRTRMAPSKAPTCSRGNAW